MIIQCEKCSTRFKVPDGKIPPEGAKVRCSRCGLVFLARLDGASAARPSAPPRSAAPPVTNAAAPPAVPSSAAPLSAPSRPPLSAPSRPPLSAPSRPPLSADPGRTDLDDPFGFGADELSGASGRPGSDPAGEPFAPARAEHRLSTPPGLQRLESPGFGSALDDLLGRGESEPGFGAAASPARGLGSSGGQGALGDSGPGLGLMGHGLDDSAELDLGLGATAAAQAPVRPAPAPAAPSKQASQSPPGFEGGDFTAGSGLEFGGGPDMGSAIDIGLGGAGDTGELELETFAGPTQSEGGSSGGAKPASQGTPPAASPGAARPTLRSSPATGGQGGANRMLDLEDEGPALALQSGPSPGARPGAGPAAAAPRAVEALPRVPRPAAVSPSAPPVSRAPAAERPRPSSPPRSATTNNPLPERLPAQAGAPSEPAPAPPADGTLPQASVSLAPFGASARVGEALAPRLWQRVALSAALLALLCGLFAAFVTWRNGFVLDLRQPEHVLAVALGQAPLEPGRAGDPLALEGLRSSVYRLQSGQELVVLRGRVVNRGAAPLRGVRVPVQLSDPQGTVRAEQVAVAGGLLDPLQVFALQDAGELASATSQQAKAVAPALAPGQRAPFEAYFWPPADLPAAQLQLQALPPSAQQP